MKKINLIIRNIIGIPILLTGMFVFLTLVSWLYSFLSKDIKTNKKFFYILFSTFRRICFFIFNIKIEFKGIQNIPKEPCIIASNHQSMIETSLIFNQYIPQITYCLKKEITSILFWNRIIRSYGGIIVNRKGGKESLKKLNEDIKSSLKEGVSVVIFPEGTRKLPKSDFKIKKGIALFYQNANSPVLPVALNTGNIMPRDSFLIRSGTITISFLEPIKPGLDSKEFLDTLEARINQELKNINKED